MTRKRLQVAWETAYSLQNAAVSLHKLRFFFFFLLSLPFKKSIPWGGGAEGMEPLSMPVMLIF